MAPQSGSKEGDTFSFGSKVQFSCFPGYKLIGANETECLSSSKWSEDMPECQRKSMQIYPTNIRIIESWLNLNNTFPIYWIISCFFFLQHAHLVSTSLSQEPVDVQNVPSDHTPRRRPQPAGSNASVNRTRTDLLVGHVKVSNHAF